MHVCAHSPLLYRHSLTLHARPSTNHNMVSMQKALPSFRPTRNGLQGPVRSLTESFLRHRSQTVRLLILSSAHLYLHWTVRACLTEASKPISTIPTVTFARRLAVNCRFLARRGRHLAPTVSVFLDHKPGILYRLVSENTNKLLASLQLDWR